MAVFKATTFFLLCALAWPGTVLAAQGTPASAVPPAPVPSQILSAKRVFISNQPGALYLNPRNAEDDPYRPYNQFYASMKGWGYYELTSAPADADLILEINLTERNVVTNATMQSPGRALYFVLTVRDPKSHTILWWIAERLQGANRTATGEKNYNQAMTNLVNDLKRLIGQAVASPNNSKN